jgi:3-isopropylmalate/(R)-2-methylmalate dehydratase small subunit
MKFTTRLAQLAHENIDTDQIIPARFLKTTSRAGLGKGLFADWRYDAQGIERPDFILNRPEMAGVQALLAGDNFGCGSSREHAPWALTDFGIKAVISTSFADIFRNNALKNGLLPIVVDKETHAGLFRYAGEVTFDLGAQALILENGSAVHFDIDPFSKKCLMEGIDELGYLVELEPRITAYEKNITAEHAENADKI